MISHEHKLIFIHVPKCAGVSVCRFFEKEGQILHRDWRSVKKNNRPHWDIYHKFAIVRNPIDMVVSSFNFWMGLDDVSNIKFHPMPLKERNIRYPKFREIVSDFDSFIDNIQKLSTLDFMAMHLRPASRFICNDFGNIMVDQVIKLEDIVEEWPKLMKSLNLKEKPLPDYNKDPLKTFEPTYVQAMKIYELYKADFEKFGYEPPRMSAELKVLEETLIAQI